jgi:hypothetical protein
MIYKTYFTFSDIMNRDREPFHVLGAGWPYPEETREFSTFRNDDCFAKKTMHGTRIGKRCVAGSIGFGRPWPSVRSTKQAFAGSVANV